jgi:hypothetical protein
MENAERLEEEGIGFGLTAAEVQSAVRRQLIGSIVVAVVIAVAAGLVAIRPAYHDTVNVAPHKSAGAQQPSFVPPSGQRVVGLRQHGREFP